MSNELRTYAITDRPLTFDDVIGHKATIKAVKRMLDEFIKPKKTKEEKSPLGFLFHSDPSCPGLGKTTLALCCVNYLKTKGVELKTFPVDCALQSKAADVKDTWNEVNAPHQAAFDVRAIIKIPLLEEIHLVNKPGIAMYLKPMEENRSDLLVIGTTTDIGKFDAAFKRRFKDFELKPLKPADMKAVLRRSLPESLGEGIEAALIRKAAGSPGRLLALAEKLVAAGDIDSMNELLDDSAVTPELQQVINRIVFPPFKAGFDYKEMHEFLVNADTAGNLNIDTFFWQLKATLNKAVAGNSEKLTDFSEGIRSGDKPIIARASLIYTLLKDSAYSDDSPVDKKAKLWNLILLLKANDKL